MSGFVTVFNLVLRLRLPRWCVGLALNDSFRPYFLIPYFIDMQYLVREIPVSSAAPSEPKIFRSLSDAITYLRKANPSRTLVLEEKEGSLDSLKTFLKERLSTVSLRVAEGGQNQWVITAF